MNPNKENVKRLMADLFPNSRITAINFFEKECSVNFIVDLHEYNNKYRTLFIKYSKKDYDTSYVCKMNMVFLKEKRVETVSAPSIYYVDQGDKIFVMDYIKGLNLYQLFTSIRPRTHYDLRQIIDLSAIALAEFHKIFSKNEYRYDVNELVKINDAEFINEHIHKCNLNFRTQLFFDFKFRNILFDPAASKLYLVDFPDKGLISTPHYDIAAFRKELYIFSQHPKFMLLNRWNNPSIIYDRFFSTYYNHLGIQPNEADKSIIKYFSTNMIKKWLNSDRKLKNLNFIKYFFIKRAYQMNMLEDV